MGDATGNLDSETIVAPNPARAAVSHAVLAQQARQAAKALQRMPQKNWTEILYFRHFYF